MECCGRPNRSDVHLSQEEAVRIEEQTREYFDGIAPKRPVKPSRSEFSDQYFDPHSDLQREGIPELLKFKHLQNDPQVYILRFSVVDSFVHTSIKDAGDNLIIELNKSTHHVRFQLKLIWYIA